MKTSKCWKFNVQLINTYVMKAVVTLTFTLLSFYYVLGQIPDYGPPFSPFNYCGTYQGGSAMESTSGSSDIKQRTINRREYIESGGVVNEVEITIPTVFHIIHSTEDDVPGSGTNVSDEMVFCMSSSL